MEAVVYYAVLPAAAAVREYSPAGQVVLPVAMFAFASGASNWAREAFGRNYEADGCQIVPLTVRDMAGLVGELVQRGESGDGD